MTHITSHLEYLVYVKIFLLEIKGWLTIGGVLVEDWLSTELGVLAVEVGVGIST